MSYWDGRKEELYEQLEKDEEKLKKRLSNYYETEYSKLDREIGGFFARYGKDNIIEYRTMMEKLSNDDMKLLMEQMELFANKYPQYAHLMPVRESIYKLNRLEGLQYSIKMQQLNIGAINNQELEKHLLKQAQRGGNASAEALGFGKKFYTVNSEFVKSCINLPWSNGDNFSKAIWNNTEKISNYLNTDISQALARGDSYERIRKNMKERFEGVSRKNMYRLIYTEGTFTMAESTMKPFEEHFEKYRISTAGDKDVCSICRDVAKETFDIKDRTPGINFPPLHPWCRCSCEVVVDDWEKWLDDYEKKYGIKAKLGNGDNGFSSNSVGRYVETIDMNDVDKYIKKYENEIKDYPVEHAYVIQGDGKVLAYTGNKSNVSFQDADLKNAIVLHNHPVLESEPTKCFQEDDFAFLQHFGMEIKQLRATYGDLRYEVSVLNDLKDVSYSKYKMMAIADVDVFVDYVDYGEYTYKLLAKEGYINYVKTKAK